MSRYDGMSTEKLEAALQAMGEIAKRYGETQWKAGQDQMHQEINQVIDELEERRRSE